MRLLSTATTVAAAVLIACSSGSSTSDSKAEKAPPTKRPVIARVPGPVATEATVTRLCGTCHPRVSASELNKKDWGLVLTHLTDVIAKRAKLTYSPGEMRALRGYFTKHSPARLPALPPVPADSPIAFKGEPLGRRGHTLPSKRENGPSIINVNVVDVDGDRTPDVLVCADIRRAVSRIHKSKSGWTEELITHINTPGHTHAYDHDGDGDLDVVVAVLGSLMPTEQHVGGAVLLTNEGKGRFSSRPILSDFPRTTDVRPGDFDGDGDKDFVVAGFGFINEGEIGWVEQKSRHKFVYHRIVKMPGALHVPVVDIDKDGDLDFVTLVSQETEQVIAFVNDGKGTFTQKVIYAAGSPTFGATGIVKADLDRDGDMDFVFTNGDAFDVPGVGPRPYHGVHWLENLGGLKFKHHRVLKWYGTYASAVGDMDGDGDLDIVAVSMFNVWSDPRRQSVIWLENDGKQTFKPHAIGGAPIHQVTVSLGDLNGDGRLDVVTGGIHRLAPPGNRMGRVTVWWNNGPVK